MLNKINKTNKKLFTLAATSLLSITIVPASSFDKTNASGLHNNQVAQTNLNNQTQNDSNQVNQVNTAPQESILDTCQTSSLDDGIYMVKPIEGIGVGIYIFKPTEGIDDGIYIKPPSGDRQDILFI